MVMPLDMTTATGTCMPTAASMSTMKWSSTWSACWQPSGTHHDRLVVTELQGAWFIHAIDRRELAGRAAAGLGRSSSKRRIV